MPKRAAMGAAKRIRPKFMTVATVLAGLIPVMWATGAGADAMKRIAAPIIGGIVTSFVLELLIYPRSTKFGRRTLSCGDNGNRRLPRRNLPLFWLSNDDLR